MKKVLCVLLAGGVLLRACPAQAQYNYAEALQKALFFEEAQRSGAVAGRTRVAWRGDAHLADGQDLGWNLAGGWYDAGDHVKWNASMSFYAATLAWSATEYPAGYQTTGQMPFLLAALRGLSTYYAQCLHYTDPADVRTYRIALDVSYTQDPATNPNPLDPANAYGDEHSYAAAHEVMDQLFPVRPTYYADFERPQSGNVAAMAAALAAASCVLRANGDPATADADLALAGKLYRFATTFRPAHQAHPDTYKNDRNQPVPLTGYGVDDKGSLCWAALWLHRAAGLQNPAFGDAYLREALALGAEFKFEVHNNLYGIGSYKLASYVLLTQYYPAGPPAGSNYPYAGGSVNWLREQVEANLSGAADGDAGLNSSVLAVSPGGLVVLGDEWGTLRHATSQGFVAFVYADHLPAGPLQAKYRAYGQRQLDYALGRNPRQRSYVLGWQPAGTTAVAKPLHATAHGIWAGFEHDIPGRPEYQPAARHTLYGALLGGPDRFDNYYPLDGNARPGVEEAGQTEVAIDYNAGFTGALARMAQAAPGGAPLAGFPAPEARTSPADDEFFVEAAVQASGGSFVEIRARLNNRSRWPARVYTNLSFRYYFTPEAGTSVTAALVADPSPPLEAARAPTISPPVACGTGYYVTITVPNEAVFPAYVYPQARRYYKEVVFRLSSSGAWDNANDWSYNGLAPLANRVPPLVATRVPVYESGQYLAGSRPASCGPLPVVLTTFTALARSARVDIAWTTASETYNQGFEVQRSADGRDFARLLVQPGQGGTQPQRYTATDAQPLPGTSYYRLLQRDTDGTGHYSSVVAVRRAPGVLGAYPNPVGDWLTLSIPDDTSGPVEVLNMMGQPVLHHWLDRPRQPVYVGQLPPGMYFVHFGGATTRVIVR